MIGAFRRIVPCELLGRGEFRAAEPVIHTWRCLAVYSEGSAGAGYLVSQRILIKFSTDSNSASLVNTVALRCWAVAMQKASA